LDRTLLQRLSSPLRLFLFLAQQRFALERAVKLVLKGKTPLLVALGLGLFAGVLAFAAIKRREADARRGWNLVNVMVAEQDIREGSTITSDMISSRAVPEQFVTSSVVRPDAVS